MSTWYGRARRRFPTTPIRRWPDMQASAGCRSNKPLKIWIKAVGKTTYISK